MTIEINKYIIIQKYRKSTIQKGGRIMCELFEATVKPSVEKPWLKYFSEEAREESLPKNTIYRHMREKNENNRGDTAINYFGKKISYGKLLDEVDRCA